VAMWRAKQPHWEGNAAATSSWAPRQVPRARRSRARSHAPGGWRHQLRVRSRWCSWPRGFAGLVALFVAGLGGISALVAARQGVACHPVGFAQPGHWLERRTWVHYVLQRGCVRGARLQSSSLAATDKGRGPGHSPQLEEDVSDPVALLRQMLSGEGLSNNSFPGGFPSIPGGAPGGAATDPLTSLLGGFGKQAGPKKTTDGFFVNRVPVLQKVKRPIMVVFFAYCLYKGWVGRFGFLQGCFGSSYFDMLAVPLRVLPNSPFYQCAFFQSQIVVDTTAKLSGWLINVMRGKAKIPSPRDLKAKLEEMQNLRQQPLGASSLWEQAAATSPSWDATAMPPAAGPPSMPTAPTTPLQAAPLQAHPMQAPLVQEAVPDSAAQPVNSRAPSRTPPPVVDADVTFLD